MGVCVPLWFLLVVCAIAALIIHAIKWMCLNYNTMTRLHIVAGIVLFPCLFALLFMLPTVYELYLPVVPTLAVIALTVFHALMDERTSGRTRAGRAIRCDAGRGAAAED